MEHVHPQLKESFDDLYKLLLNQGYSAQEAMERLFVVFDWEVRGATTPIIRSRLDEYARSEEERMAKADAGVDLNQVWFELRLGGVSDEILGRFIEECASLEYLGMVFWIASQGLTKNFNFGHSLAAVQAEDC